MAEPPDQGQGCDSMTTTALHRRRPRRHLGFRLADARRVVRPIAEIEAEQHGSSTDAVDGTLWADETTTPTAAKPQNRTTQCQSTQC